MSKKSTRDGRGLVRIGPRISRGTYQMAKYVYGMKGINFEDQIEELLDRDIDYQMKQKWFLNAMVGKEGERFERLRNGVKTFESAAAASMGVSDFDKNDVNGDGSGKEDLV
jgi:hypothetical protein